MNCKSSRLGLTLLAFTISAGVAKADSCNAVSAANNLVQNCAFGTGDFTSWTGTATTDTIFNGVDQGDPLALGTTPYKGLANEAELGAFAGTETLTQTLPTVAGMGYQVEFALLNDTATAPGYPNLFSASFGANTFFTENNAPADPYTLYTFYLTATGTSTPLTFTEENNLGDFELTSVSVGPAPEPGTLVLAGTGLAGVAGAMRRRARR